MADEGGNENIDVSVALLKDRVGRLEIAIDKLL